MVTVDSREQEIVCLYVLIRTDIDSLDRGKACAQSTHAANQCVYDIRHSQDDKLRADLTAWEGDRGFGTAVILNGRSIFLIQRLLTKLKVAGHHAAIVHDDSYPIVDGKFVHKAPVDTCAYVFGVKTHLEPFVGHLERY